MRNSKFKNDEKIIKYSFFAAINNSSSQRNYLGGKFKVFCDQTEHFNFVCDECGKVAKVDNVRFDVFKDVSAEYSLIFWLVCSKCKLIGYRKISMKSDRKHFE